MKCKVENCVTEVLAKGLCIKHYTRLRRSGSATARNLHDPNEYTIRGDYCELFLYNIRGDVVEKTLIDFKDLEDCLKQKWHLDARMHVVNSSMKRLSRFLLGEYNPRIEIDHKNCNTLDNRRKNLRRATDSQNKGNMNLRRDNKSGFKGVFFLQKPKKWLASIRFHGRSIYLGRFILIEDAARAYNKAAIKYFGCFARINGGV
jgi:hypothetical protein